MIRVISTVFLGAAIGVMFFYTFIVTLNIFDVLPQNSAAQLLDRLFPIYYRVQYILLGLPWLLNIASKWSARGRSKYGTQYGSGPKPPSAWLVGLISFVFLLVIVGGFIILPQMEAARQAMGPEMAAEGTPLRETWGRLHGMSMGMNIVALAGTLIAAFWAAL